MLELPRPAGGDHGNPHRLRDGPGEGKVVAVLGAVGIHRGQQDLPRSEVLQSHHPLHGFESGGLASPPNPDFPPLPPPPSPPPPFCRAPRPPSPAPPHRRPAGAAPGYAHPAGVSAPAGAPLARRS